jgi:hypothetical protein
MRERVRMSERKHKLRRIKKVSKDYSRKINKSKELNAWLNNKAVDQRICIRGARNTRGLDITSLVDRTKERGRETNMHESTVVRDLTDR